MKMHVLILCFTFVIEFGQPFFAVNKLVRITESNKNGTITSPGYPRHYPNNANYIWDLVTGFRHGNVSFCVKSMDICKNIYGKCEGDYLEIEERDPCCFRHFKRCGKESNISFMATGNKIRISFVSDGRDTARGFVLFWHGFLPSSSSSSLSTTSETITTNPMTTMNNSVTTMSETTLTTSELASTNETSTRANQSITKTPSTQPVTKKTCQCGALFDTIQTGFGNRNITPSLLISGFCVLEVTVVTVGVYLLRQCRGRTPPRRPSEPEFYSNNFYDTIPADHIHS